MKYFVSLLMTGAGLLPAAALADPTPGTGALAAPLSQADAWRRLPVARKGSGQPLPIWARMMAGEFRAVPRRSCSSIAPSGRRARSIPSSAAAMRWVAAHANRCTYAYTTRISNGFQLKLERENVFYDYYNTKPQRDDAAGATRPRGNPVALLTDEECWKRMPTPASGSGRPLPNWAKAVAANLPRTAAAMLDLDHAQRKRGPLDPVLRAKMRWVVAHANRCAYAEAYALADLRRAGGDEEEARTLTGEPSGWRASDRDPLEFARLLTVAAPTIKDELFGLLRHRYGNQRVAAMVLLAAYGNFQDRLVLGLNLPIEDGGPLPALEVTSAGAFQSVPSSPRSQRLPGCSRREQRSSIAIPSGRSSVTRSCSPLLEAPAWPDPETSRPHLGGSQEEAAPCDRREAERGSSGTLSAPAMFPSLPSPGASRPARCGPRRSPTGSSRRACSGSRPGASAATTAWAIVRCCSRSRA